MFCGHCGAAVCDSHRYRPTCGRPTGWSASDRTQSSLKSNADAAPRNVDALIDAAVSYERLAVETNNLKKYIPLALAQYKIALNTLTKDADPELFCTVSYYLARLYAYAEGTEAHEDVARMGSMGIPVWEARRLLESVLPLAKRIQHPHYSDFCELYKTVIPGRLGD